MNGQQTDAKEPKVPPTIGLIGLGIMGQAMAANIMQAGFPLTVYNRTPAKAEALSAAGACVAGSPKEVAESCDTVIMMLTGPAAVDAVLEGENGVLAADAAGKTVINMSTVPPAYSRALADRLADRGIIFIDAPVSGSKVAAEQRSLVILASGAEARIGELESLLLSMGSRVVYCGEAGHGSAMKLSVNLLLAIMMEGLAEATNFAEKSGLAAETFLEVVASGPLACTLFKLKQEMLETGRYPVQFPFRHMAKDMGFVVDAAAENGAAIPLGGRAAELFSPDASVELLDQDFAAVRSLLERS